MKYIKTYETYNTIFDEDSEKLNEGWKHWLAAGLLTLSSIAGVYKLNKDSQEAFKHKKEYTEKLCKSLDDMKKDDVKGLKDIGVRTLDGEFYEFKGLKSDTYSDTLSMVKQQIQENPFIYGVDKDGNVVLLNFP